MTTTMTNLEIYVPKDIQDIILGYKDDLENNEKRRSICYNINKVSYGLFHSPPYLHFDFNYFRTVIMDIDSVDYWVFENYIDLETEIESYKTYGSNDLTKRNNRNSCVISNRNNDINRRNVKIMSNQIYSLTIKNIKLSLKMLDKMDNGGFITFSMKNDFGSAGDYCWVVRNDNYHSLKYYVLKETDKDNQYTMRLLTEELIEENDLNDNYYGLI